MPRDQIAANLSLEELQQMMGLYETLELEEAQQAARAKKQRGKIAFVR